MTVTEKPTAGDRDPAVDAVDAIETGHPARVVDQALRRGVDHLRRLQDPSGWWKGELETNVTMDAEDLMLRHVLGMLDPAVAQRAARRITSRRNDDGGWPTFHGGPSDVSTTIEAWVALRLAGVAEDDAVAVRAATWVTGQGGIARARVFTRIWLAVLGAWDWDALPVVPPEMLLLPSWAPLNVYDFACWARQTIVALTVVMAHRPSRPLPFAVTPLGDAVPPRPAASLRSTAGRFWALDRALHTWERLPVWFLPRTLVRRASLSRAERWIVRRQEADGSWGGIQPPLVYSVIALHLQGYGPDHPVMRAALDAMDAFVLDDGDGRRVEACQSPVWDTALSVVALADAGVPADDPAMVAARRWLVDEEVTVSGDWSVRRPDLAPGGWAFEFANDNYPDVDDTAEVVLALRRAGVDTLATDAGRACRRAVDWVVGMQGRDGGWAAFDADNDSALCARLPFCDFGRVTDPATADVTAHVLEMLATEPGVDPDVLARGVRWLSEAQEPDGSWWGRWGVNHVYGTGAVVPALIAVGVEPGDLRVRRAVRWLVQHQNADGGWGEDIRSYTDQAWRGRGTSTASQTAWALLALLAAGEAGAPATRAGIDWLVATQTADGTWDEPWFTGTGFPGDFSINYHLYRLMFPLSALGRYATATRP